MTDMPSPVSPLFLEPSPQPLPKRIRHPVTPAVAVGRISVALGNLPPEARGHVLASLVRPPSKDQVDAVAYCERVLGHLDLDGREKVLTFIGAK